jgi:hypothetical protein
MSENDLEHYKEAIKQIGKEKTDELFDLLEKQEEKRWKDEELEAQTGIPHFCGKPISQEIKDFFNGDMTNAVELKLFKDE